ncbi:hypothetical protein COV18_00915 [Candidatus Woesearchaeota archaeon CG10_big_fil_rev_8_21_14_0_10_37_12]|nr:MAG: hypothetical protein COV18_00915 [Candidatus Woesearchaeota archaeon CG10_big_fil_rev_8_21_14_0_10_37_12]
MNLTKLRNIGLTEGEIKVYEALLKLGETTKTNLAKESGIAPSNVYDVTNRLLEKGIISKIEKNGIAHFSPANPNRIFTFLEQKKKEINEEQDIVASLLPSLLAEFTANKKKTSVEVFQGWNGLKTVFEELINDCKKGDANYVFGASEGETPEQADRFFLKYSKQRAKKGITTNIIFNDRVRERKKRFDFFQKSKKCNIRFLNQSTPAEIIVYKDKACIIILTREPLTIRITAASVAESFKQYFEVLWKQARL